MTKKSICLIILLCVSVFLCTSEVLSGETDKGSVKKDTNYSDFINKMVLWTSAGAHYIPRFYPDSFYVGPNYAQLMYQDPILYTEKDVETKSILIDLKWELEKDWFMGIYSELERKDEDRRNAFDNQTEDEPMDADFGIVFIHKF